MGNRKQITKKVSPLVTMLRSDYDILVNVYKEFSDSNLFDSDISFLMGKDDGYFFSILDPTEKTRFKEDFLPIFVPIFGTMLAGILPGKYFPGEEVKLTSTTKFNRKSTIYRHTVTYADGTVEEDIEWKKKVEKGVRKKENETLTTFLRHLIAEGYFVAPRTALHLFIHLREHYIPSFTVSDLKVSLGKLIRSQGDKRPLLQRNNDNARFTYSENYFIELTANVDALSKLSGIEPRDMSSLTLYTLASLDKNTLGFIGLDGRKLVAIYVLPEYHRIRLGTRMIDFAMTLDKVNPFVVEVPIGSLILPFLEACGFRESPVDKKHREENGLEVVKLGRKK